MRDFNDIYLKRRENEYKRQKFVWILKFVLFIVVAVGSVFLWKANSLRLEKYNEWYLCMYNDWNSLKCNDKVYGK